MPTMAKSMVILSGGMGKSWRVDRGATMPVLERAHVPLLPCPHRWSRVDYLYGADDECAMPVLVREMANWLAIVACAPAGGVRHRAAPAVNVVNAHKLWCAKPPKACPAPPTGRT